MVIPPWGDSKSTQGQYRSPFHVLSQEYDSRTGWYEVLYLLIDQDHSHGDQRQDFSHSSCLTNNLTLKLSCKLFFWW